VKRRTSKNLKAFLDTIAYAEGTDNQRQETKNHGYDVICGGSLFTDYSDHPRKLVRLKSLGISSTAACRYQVLKRYYDHYKAQLKLPDFSPASQDRIAIQLIRECGAFADIEEGRIETALHKCRSRWASLPGAGYNQHEHSMEKLLDVFRSKLD
jgi:muramidase (phage lysozyme)